MESYCIIRGNITNLKYWVHSPYISPDKNITCDNEGNIIKYKYMNFESINKITFNYNNFTYIFIFFCDLFIKYF